MKAIDRFETKYIIDAVTNCWNWTDFTDVDGYGRLHINNRRWNLAHRFSYENFIGPIPKDLCVCHTCDNPSCVNPAHLWVGTKAQNTADMVNKGRAALGIKNGLAKLTESDIIAIRNDKRSLRKIAPDYNVSFTTISRVKNRLIWGHI